MVEGEGAALVAAAAFLPGAAFLLVTAFLAAAVLLSGCLAAKEADVGPRVPAAMAKNKERREKVLMCMALMC